MGKEVTVVLRSELEPWERGLVTGLTGAVLGILAHGMVDSVFHEPALVILLIVCGGFVFALQSIKKPDSARQTYHFFSIRYGSLLFCSAELRLRSSSSSRQRGGTLMSEGRPRLKLDGRI